MPKLPEKIEDWTAPWEKEGVELDPVKIKKLTWDLLKDQEKNRATLAENRTTIATLTDERDSLKDKADTAGASDSDKDAEILQLKKDLRASGTRVEQTKDYDSVRLERDRYRVALEKELSATQAKRLVGATYEELLEDADALRADLGLIDDDSGSHDDDGVNVGDLRFNAPPAAYRIGSESLSGGSIVEADPSKVSLPPL